MKQFLIFLGDIFLGRLISGGNFLGGTCFRGALPRGIFPDTPFYEGLLRTLSQDIYIQYIYWAKITRDTRIKTTQLKNTCVGVPL